jgi:hypothetical protein
VAISRSAAFGTASLQTAKGANNEKAAAVAMRLMVLNIKPRREE